MKKFVIHCFQAKRLAVFSEKVILMEKVCVIGLGYIGLPTASLLATKGFIVHGVDVDEKTVDIIRRGEIHIHEPALDVLVKSAVNSGNLSVSLEPSKADVFIIAVPTPFREEHTPDISFIRNATISIASHLMPGNLVILESTSPVGTTEKIGDWLRELRPDLRFPSLEHRTSFYLNDKDQVCLAHCPERVLPGQILRELIDNDRIIGGLDQYSAEVACNFYQKFVNGDIIVTDSRTAELSKLVENAFRDVNIAFANELSVICDRLDINIWELIELANRHPRVNILKPGPGVGGHCIAVDPWFIVDSAPEEAKLIRVAREINSKKPFHVVDRIREKASRLKGPVIACLGLSYKADIDDLRESPAVEIVKRLSLEQIGLINVVEPHVKEIPEQISGLNNVHFVDLTTALYNSDIVVLLVDHKFFKNIGREMLKEKIVIDTRGIW